MVWLFAFLVHSTLWCSLAWLWTRSRPGTSARLRETIWYTAIAASLITPTAQILVSPEAAFWRLPLPAALIAGPAGEHSEIAAAGAASWQGVAHWSWFAIAGVLVLSYCGRLVALRRRLGRREIVADPRARRALSRLARRAGLHRPPVLTESESLGSPIAIGLGKRREICVPTRALRELDQAELRALLGHEVAHHLRNDTLRLGVLNTLLAVFFFQPFFRLAVRAAQFAAEEQCDDWAARQLDDRLAMASCLTEVAGWVVDQERHLPAACMAQRHSPLRVRVDRLLDERRSLEPPSRGWRGLSCLGLLALAPWLAPAVAPAGVQADGEHGTEHRERGAGASEEHHDRTPGDGGEHRAGGDGEHGGRRARR